MKFPIERLTLKLSVPMDSTVSHRCPVQVPILLHVSLRLLFELECDSLEYGVGTLMAKAISLECEVQTSMAKTICN